VCQGFIEVPQILRMVPQQKNTTSRGKCGGIWKIVFLFLRKHGILYFHKRTIPEILKCGNAETRFIQDAIDGPV
jgi:hypothetical protein